MISCSDGFFKNDFIVFKQGTLPNLKKVEAIVKMLVPKTSHDTQVFND
jgi:hypothetical protein